MSYRKREGRKAGRGEGWRGNLIREDQSTKVYMVVDLIKQIT